jgi:glucose-6-phosphate 1-epimerase
VPSIVSGPCPTSRHLSPSSRASSLVLHSQTSFSSCIIAILKHIPSSITSRNCTAAKMERKNRPAPIPSSPSFQQPSVDLTDNVLTARLPSGDSVTVYLYGATVTSWKTANGAEKLFLSSAAALDGSKPIRGGIPLVFPVFGPPPKDHATGQLPQHGFARNNFWEFLGKSSTESTGKKADDSVKLDFGLSSGMLDEATRKKWPQEFGLVYSVTLGKGSLKCALHVQNKGVEAFEFQCLFHTYLAVKVTPLLPAFRL